MGGAAAFLVRCRAPLQSASCEPRCSFRRLRLVVHPAIPDLEKLKLGKATEKNMVYFPAMHNFQELLHSRFLLFCLIGALSGTWREARAQAVITGRVQDAATGAPLYPATVLDTTSGVAVYADSAGYYRLEVRPGDAIRFSYLGFYSETFQVPVGLTRMIHDVKLISRKQKLQQVEVRAMTPYQQDSLERAQAFGDYMNQPDTRLLDRQPPETGGFGLTLHPFSYFSKGERRKRQFQKSFPQLEREAFIDSRYTPELVTRLTGLRGDSLRQFLYRFRPEYSFTRQASDLEFWSWIKMQYRAWTMPK